MIGTERPDGKSGMLITAAVCGLMLTSPSVEAADPNHERVNLILELVLKIDEANSFYSGQMARFIGTIASSRPEAMPPDERAALVEKADYLLELGRLMDKVCEAYRQGNLAVLLEKTRCSRIAEDAAFVREYRARALSLSASAQ